MTSKGVSANSRIVPHRYADEGDKGPAFRRLIRRREAALWRREAERPVIYPVLVGLQGNYATTELYRRFQVHCWGVDAEPEYVDATSYDARADGVTTVPTIRVYDDADPYGDPLVEHVGAADNDMIRDLLRKARDLVA